MIYIATLDNVAIIVLLEGAVIFGWNKCWRLFLLPLDLVIGKKVLHNASLCGSMSSKCDIIPRCHYYDLLFDCENHKRIWLQVPKAFFDEEPEKNIIPQNSRKVRIEYYQLSRFLLVWNYEDAMNFNLKSLKKRVISYSSCLNANHRYVYNIKKYYISQLMGMSIFAMLAILSFIVVHNNMWVIIGAGVLILLGGYIGKPVLLFPLDYLIGKQVKMVFFNKIASVRLCGMLKTRYCCDLMFDDLGCRLRLRTPTVYTRQELLMGRFLPENGQLVRVEYYKYSRIILSWKVENGSVYEHEPHHEPE